MKRHPFLTASGLILALVLTLSYFAALGPDFDVKWERRVPSTHNTLEIGRAIDELKMWPVYYHDLKEAKLDTGTVTASTDPKINRKVTQGDVIELKIEPPQKEWKRFSLTTRVTHYEPGKSMAFELLEDSKDKITKMFSNLTWDIRVEAMTDDEIKKAKNGIYQSWIIGRANAHTATWRGRLFARISPEILMNQVYVIDLVKLGTLERQVAAKKDNLAPNYQ